LTLVSFQLFHIIKIAGGDEKKATLAIEDREIPVEDIIIPQGEMPFPPLGEEMVEKIKRTIKRYGLVYKPVVIPTKEGNKTKYYLIDGRSRLNALMKLNCREIPCCNQCLT